MNVKLAKDSEEWNFFQDYWKFRQQYYIPEKADIFWEEMAKEAESINKKYGNNQYFKDLLLAHINDLERKFKNAGIK